MLSQDDYNNLPVEQIKRWNNTGKFNGDMSRLDVIRQRMGMRPINYSCDGCKEEALRDGYNLIMEFENNEQAVKNG